MSARAAHSDMKIISQPESRQILRNLYKRAAMEKYADQLRRATAEKRAKLLARVETEVREQIHQQSTMSR